MKRPHSLDLHEFGRHHCSLEARAEKDSSVSRTRDLQAHGIYTIGLLRAARVSALWIYGSLRFGCCSDSMRFLQSVT